MIAEAMQNNQYGWSLLPLEASMTTLNRVPRIALAVRDMRVSANWYERVLGFDFVEDLHVPPGAALYTSTSTAVAIAEPTFSNAERLALAGFLAGYTGLTRAGVDPGLGFANLRACTPSDRRRSRVDMAILLTRVRTVLPVHPVTKGHISRSTDSGH